ncbi:hypothetical protein Tco_0271165 [Tanacetum coccineum]
MENEHELSYETLTRVYLGSYEHYKGVVAGLRFLNFFNDPRIIREQRIAAYNGYRRGRHMEKLGPDVGGLENELYKLVCKVEEDEGHIGVFGVATKFSQQKGEISSRDLIESYSDIDVEMGYEEGVLDTESIKILEDSSAREQSKEVGKSIERNTIVHPPSLMMSMFQYKVENKWQLRLEEEVPTQGIMKISEDSEPLNSSAGYASTNDDSTIEVSKSTSLFVDTSCLALKTRGCLESMSFDDSPPLILLSSELPAQAQSLIILINRVLVPSDSQHLSRFYSRMNLICIFCAENEPDKDMTIKNFDQVDQLEMEELDFKWHGYALPSINRFREKA